MGVFGDSLLVGGEKVFTFAKNSDGDHWWDWWWDTVVSLLSFFHDSLLVGGEKVLTFVPKKVIIGGKDGGILLFHFCQK